MIDCIVIFLLFFSTIFLLFLLLKKTLKRNHIHVISKLNKLTTDLKQQQLDPVSDGLVRRLIETTKFKG